MFTYWIKHEKNFFLNNIKKEYNLSRSSITCPPTNMTTRHLFKILKQRLSFELCHEDRSEMISVKLMPLKHKISLNYLAIWCQGFSFAQEPYMWCNVKKKKKHSNNIANFLQLSTITDSVFFLPKARDSNQYILYKTQKLKTFYVDFHFILPIVLEIKTC